MNDHVTDSHRAPEPVGPYPHARRAGDYIFLSGVGPRSRGTKEIPGVTLSSDGNIVDYCIETQCRSCFENVQKVVEDSGARWDEVVDVAVYLTDMKKDFKVFFRAFKLKACIRSFGLDGVFRKLMHNTLFVLDDL